MCPAFYKNSRSSQQTAPVPFRKRDRSCFFASLHGAYQERGDLRSRAGGGGVEVTAAHAGGDAVLHGPRHGLRVVAVSGDVGKARRTARHRLARGPPQHRHHLGAVDGGAVVGSEEIIKSLSFYLGLYGANLGATESWLLARSLRTLPLRVKKMAENGLALAKFFESHPKVEKVYYPGLESSPSKALADKQFEGNGYGGMLCVNFKGGQKEIDKLISNLQLVRFVPTLAGVGTTLTYPPRASHRDLSPDELAAIGITMGQIRLSSGLEDTDDLLNDFDQALAKM